MIPIICPLCNSLLCDDDDVETIRLECCICVNYRYFASPSNHIETAIFNKYRIYNYYDLIIKNINFAEIQLFKYGGWQILHSFDHNIIISQSTIDRFINLKAFS